MAANSIGSSIADPGAKSFCTGQLDSLGILRRRPPYGSLLECREQAVLHLKAVLASADDPEHTKAQHARRAAAARDFQERVEAAIATVTELQKQRKPSDKPARASTTDAEARVMKMADGGFRPAYNVQYSVAGSELGGPRTVVGVQVTNVGSDMGSLTPMAEQIQERTGELPKVVLADGGCAKNEDITALRAKGVDVLVPPPESWCRRRRMPSPSSNSDSKERLHKSLLGASGWRRLTPRRSTAHVPGSAS